MDRHVYKIVDVKRKKNDSEYAKGISDSENFTFNYDKLSLNTKRALGNADYFGFEKFKSLVNKNNVDYTLSAKLKYYSKRVDNPKLTIGQRKYAQEFINKYKK